MGSMNFGDSYGSSTVPPGLPGHGATLDTRPPWFRVGP